MPRTRILLADDNSAVLNYVSKLLERNYEIVGALNDGEAVLRDWPSLRPDVIVLDISMGETNGIELARGLRKSRCKSQIIFLTIHQSPAFVKAALDAGGSGYVVKSRMRQDLILAIDATLSGTRFVSPNLAEMRAS